MGSFIRDGGASVIVFLVVTGLLSATWIAYNVLAALGRRPRSAEQAARGQTMFLPLYLREYWDWTISPVTRVLIAVRAKPNDITVFSLVASAAAGLAFGAGYAGMGGWLYILCGTCDIFDGKVARATGQQTKTGAFVDSTLDRYTEMFVLAGLGWHFSTGYLHWCAIAAICGSVMVSYTRARGEALGYSSREGGMQRAERVVYIGLAGVFGKMAEAMVGAPGWSDTLLGGALVLLAVSTNVSAVQRFFDIVRALRSREEQERTVPTIRRDKMTIAQAGRAALDALRQGHQQEAKPRV